MTTLTPQIQRQVRKRYRSEDLLITAGWLIIAIPVGIYFAINSFNLLTSPRNLLEGLGILAGLIGTAMILLMLLLAGRIPFVEQTFGQDKVILLHSKLGKPSFYLIILHVLLLTLAYSISAKVSFWGETVSLFQSTGDMVQAYISLALLVILVGTSLVFVRKRVPYETWHVIHLISYAMVVFALPHQLSMSSVFTANSWERLYWVILYYGTMIAVIIFRGLLPVMRSSRHRLRLENGTWLTDDVYAMEISGRNLDRLKLTGGQFLVFRFLDRRTIFQAHPFSLSDVPSRGGMRITFKVAGNGTRRLTRLDPGTPIFFEGPYGVFTHKQRSRNDTLLLGSGIGITPILAFLKDTPKEQLGKHTAVVIRNRDMSSVYHLDEFAHLAKEKNVKLYKSEGPRHPERDSWLSATDAERGVNIKSYIRDPLSTDVFICGEQTWMNLAMEDALNSGIPKEVIHMERFTL